MVRRALPYNSLVLTVRRDLDGSCTRHHLDIGLMVYIYQGVQYSVQSCATTNPMELEQVTHRAKKRYSYITNVYLPPHRSGYSSKHQNDQLCLHQLPIEPGLVCGEINAHHSFWDDYVSTDPRGSVLHEWMEERSKVGEPSLRWFSNMSREQ